MYKIVIDFLDPDTGIRFDRDDYSNLSVHEALLILDDYYWGRDTVRLYLYNERGPVWIANQYTDFNFIDPDFTEKDPIYSYMYMIVKGYDIELLNK